MKILHYVLGFPPMRSGGLTRYAIDLMRSQKKLSHDVYAVYPGNFSFFSTKRNVVRINEKFSIPTFKIKNALPLPLFHGLSKGQSFVCDEKQNIDAFMDFFAKNKFDVLHVHTMMGLPVAFLKAAKQNGVKIVYTSHDYFGLCPRVNFIDNHGEVCVDTSAEHCAMCNVNAKPLWYIWLRNSQILPLMKKILKR